MREQGERLLTETEKGGAYNWEGGEGPITGREGEGHITGREGRGV